MERETGRTDMPHGTDCPYPIRILAFFEMIRLYHDAFQATYGGEIGAKRNFVIDTTTFPPAKFPDKYDRDRRFYR